AGNPLRLVVKDWALEPETATELDQTPPRGHPAYGLPPRLQNLCDGKLLLGSTEVGTQHGGFLEGALEAAERCLRQLTPSPIHPFAVGRQGEF
ncbi:MAG: monoamine oxidase, partial [Myxococcota bacterium]